MNISGYELIEKIGEGGMATVWKARQLSLDRIVAIKILGKSSLPDSEARERFRKEAQIAARLNHPGIVQVFDTGELDDTAYLVMEHVDGQTVGDLILEQVAMGETRALEIVWSVARALSYAWEKECLIHCDIKPDNILIDRNTGMVKVADLGLSRLISLRQQNNDSDLIIGTPNYTAPEQSAGVPDLDCRADMYSLGATLYHMVTGVLPFRDAVGSQAMTRHEEDYLEDPKVINPTVSNACAWLIEKLMIKNRALRPHFWTQVVKDLEEVRNGRLPHPPLPEEGASTVRRSPDRTAAIPVVKPRPVLPKKPAGDSPKLTIKKADLPLPPAAPKKSSGAKAVLAIAVLILIGTSTYTYKFINERFNLWTSTPEPVAVAVEAEQESDIVWDDEMNQPETTSRPEIWRNPDFLQGARLFNQALADYKNYQETRQNPDILKEVESNCRDAISYFEACREAAPASIDIGMYIDQCYGLIANVRHSTQLDVSKSAPSTTGPVVEKPVTPSVSGGRRDIVYIEDEAESASISVEPPPVTEKMLRIALDNGWDRKATGLSGMELQRLLSRHAQPTKVNEIDANVVLYPGITCMMTARDAARVLQQDLPIRRALETPGFPAGSLFCYQFNGDFAGAQELTLIVDQNSRVVMAQLFDNRTVPARMDQALFSSNWSMYDFVNGRQRDESDGLIAHRVRKRDNLIRLDSELAANTEGPERLVKARVALMMPSQLAGMILHIAQASR